MNLLLVTPEPGNDPVHAALLTRLLTHKLQQRLYYAQCAGLGWGVSTHSRGLSLVVDGFSQRAPLLARDVLEALVTLDPTESEAEVGPSQQQQQLESKRLLYHGWFSYLRRPIDLIALPPFWTLSAIDGWMRTGAACLWSWYYS